MNYEYLKIFFVVAKYKNLTKAAKELFTSQPALSRVISNLESELNAKLFYRTKNGVELTEEGSLLYNRVSSSLEDLENIEEEIKKYHNLRQQEIKIGTTATALKCYLLDVLEKFKNKHQDIRFKISTGSTQYILNDVRSGKIDIAFITTPFQITPDIDLKYIHDIKTILICGPMYKNEIKDVVSLEDITNYPFILLAKDMKFREYIDSYLEKKNTKIIPQFEADSSDSILPLVEHNYGLSFIPDKMAEASIKNQLSFEVKLKEELPPRQIALITLKKKHINKYLKELINQCDKN